MIEGEERVYALYPVFAAERPLGVDVSDASQEVENLFKGWNDVSVRGVYSTVGFRADADLMLWLVAGSADALQDGLIAFRRTAIGQRLRLAWSFMGVVKPAEFTADHSPAFVRGVPPARYACVYPFVRSSEWYLLPRDERAALLREHGEIGREFPDVLANTTSAFALNDWEWILAFEAERLDRIVDCIRRLREAEARRFTKEEVPFVTGIRKDVADALADLV
jgi:hydrogen peroxide-dependent heme synthase